MSRSPELRYDAAYPTHTGYVRHEPAHADYSDDICNENLEALRELVRAEVEDSTYELVDAPAW